jgi:hypothetical protein
MARSDMSKANSIIRCKARLLRPAEASKGGRKLREAAGANIADSVALAISPAAREPEPKVPADLKRTLAAAPTARQTWLDITPQAAD